MNKARLRERLKASRAEIENRPVLDRQIAQRLLAFLAEAYPSAETVFTYVSVGSEADTRAFIESAAKKYTLYYPLTGIGGETVAVKALKFKNLTVGKYGNLSADCFSHAALSGAPAPQITVTPLLGFNESLHRIGYGKGCYDRYFSANPKTVKIGLAYDSQLCDFTPDAYDVALDHIVTPTKLLTKIDKVLENK